MVSYICLCVMYFTKYDTLYLGPSMLLQMALFHFFLWLSNIPYIYIPHLGKAMAPYSSILAWKIPWMEEPGRLQFMGLRRVRHDWATSLLLFTFMHWRRKWQPTPVFLSGESQGRRSLVACCLWGRTLLKWLSSSSSMIIISVNTNTSIL